MSEWLIIAIAAIFAILSRIESISIKFKGSQIANKHEQPKQLKK